MLPAVSIENARIDLYGTEVYSTCLPVMPANENNLSFYLCNLTREKYENKIEDDFNSLIKTDSQDKLRR